MSFNIGYVSVSRLFPTCYVTTALGIVNLVSHLITIAAPMVAELHEPVPMICFCANAASAIVFGLQLLEVEKAEQMKRDKERQEREDKLK